MEEYSGEDLQIIACPSTEQVQLTGNWNSLTALQHLSRILWRRVPWDPVRNHPLFCASSRLTSCCLWISNVPGLASGDAGERSSHYQEPRSWDGVLRTGASEKAGPTSTRTIRHPALVQRFSSDWLPDIDRDLRSLFICFLAWFYFMQIKTGVVVRGAFMCEILCCFTGADLQSRFASLFTINLHRMWGCGGEIY